MVVVSILLKMGIIVTLSCKKITVSKLRAAKLIELQNMTRGKYFRIAADVIVDGKSLGGTDIVFSLRF